MAHQPMRLNEGTVSGLRSTPEAQRLKLIHLPAYAPVLYPDEGVWRLLKRSLANVCAAHQAIKVQIEAGHSATTTPPSSASGQLEGIRVIL